MNHQEYQQKISETIARLMNHESRQWKCDKLSTESEVDVKTIRRTVKAEHLTTIPTIRKISKAFGIKPGQLLTMVDDLCDEMEAKKRVV